MNEVVGVSFFFSFLSCKVGDWEQDMYAHSCYWWSMNQGSPFLGLRVLITIMVAVALNMEVWDWVVHHVLACSDTK